jgi:hypothetical protein
VINLSLEDLKTEPPKMHYANLSEGDLKEVKKLEEKLNTVLIAYDEKSLIQ